VTRGKLAQVAPLLRRPRYEVFPAASTEEAVLEWVPSDLPVTVTASPAKGLGPTLDLTEKLAARGYRVIPHLSARLVRDNAHLAEIVARPGTPTRPPGSSTAHWPCSTGSPRWAARSPAWA